jgi:hypothetical protein
MRVREFELDSGVIPMVKSERNKESENWVAESVIPNKYRHPGTICIIVWGDFPVIKWTFNPYGEFVCVRDLKFNPENLQGTLCFVRDIVTVF